MESTSRDPREIARDALVFASDQLGPASERHLTDAGSQALVLSHLRTGATLEDAVLTEIHRAARDDREIAGEFLAFFLAILVGNRTPRISDGLRRFLDTADLVQSVVGDVWTELGELRFEGQASFLALLAKRLSWKAAGHARAKRGATRREDLREPLSESAPPPSESPGAATLAELTEERQRLILALLRLPERDRLLVRLHLRGESIGGIMAETGLSYEAARKALRRAMARARSLIAHRERSSSPAR